MKLKLAIGFMVFLLGACFGMFFRPDKQKNTVASFDKVKITPTILVKEGTNDELIKLREMQTEFVKAKSYYEKAFNIFIVTLGLRLNTEQKEQVKNLLKDPKDFIVNNVNTNGAPSSPEVHYNEDPRVSEFANNNSFTDYLKKENAFTEHIEDANLMKKSGAFMLKDPAVYKARAKFIRKFPKIKKFNGEYSGKLYIITGKKKGETHLIETQIDFSVKDEDKIDGSFVMKISHEGNVYSNSNGRGGNGDIRLKDSSIIIESSPDTFFHFQNEELTIANFYRAGKLQGIARFEKK